MYNYLSHRHPSSKNLQQRAQAEKDIKSKWVTSTFCWLYDEFSDNDEQAIYRAIIFNYLKEKLFLNL